MANDPPADGLDHAGWSEQIRQIRQAHGLSLEQLARLVDVSYTTVSRWERGHAAPAPRTAARLREAVERLQSPATVSAGQADGAEQIRQEGTPFVGRAAELGRLSDVWSTSRFLTLTGPGGVGKSRLAMELLRRTGDPVIGVVPLDLVSDPALTGAAISYALRTPTKGTGSDTATIADSLGKASGVVVLDTCERVRYPLAAITTRILAEAPAVRLMATSQAPLGIPEERTWRVAPLDATTDDSDAVRLFLARAREKQPDFVADRQSLDAVREICTRVSGLPLALQLAAGWMSLLTPAQLLQRWGEHGALLSDATATAERHRTTAAAVEWSAALLTPEDQRLVAALSVFTGPFVLEDIESIAAPADGADVLSRVRRLIDLSWLDFVATEPAHYRMLEPLQDWGRRRLAETGLAASAHRRLAQHVSELSERADREHYQASQPAQWRNRLNISAANISASLRWSVELEPPLAVRTAVSLLGWWRSSGRLSEGRHWLALARRDGDPVSQARCACAESLLALDMGDYGATNELASAALGPLDAAGDDLWAARALTAASSAAKYLGQPESAREQLERAVERLDRLGDKRELAVALNNLGALTSELNDLPAAQGLYGRSLRLKRDLGDVRSIALTMANLADTQVRAGDIPEALDSLTDAVAIVRELNDPFLLAFVRINRGEARLAAGDPAAALEDFGAAWDSARDLDVARFQALAACGAGQALLALGETARGLQRLRAARRIAERIGDEIVLAQVRAAMSDALGGAEEVRPPRNLSAREVQVLRALIAGWSNRDIARQLQIELTTVQRHLSNIYTKLNVPNRTAAAMAAQELGLRRASSTQPYDRHPG